MGWFSDITKKAEKGFHKYDPVGSKIYDTMAKVPGSLEALHSGLSGGVQGKYSWNPYDPDQIAVGDVWGGGTVKSKDPEARAIGRQIGTMIGSYFGGQALGGLMSGGGEAASAGYTGTTSELAADGLGGVDMFGATAGGETAAGVSALDSLGTNAFTPDYSLSNTSIVDPSGYSQVGTTSEFGGGYDPGWSIETPISSTPTTDAINSGTTTSSSTNTDPLGEMIRNDFNDPTSTQSYGNYLDTGVDPSMNPANSSSGGGWTTSDWVRAINTGKNIVGGIDSYRSNRANMKAYKPYVEQHRQLQAQLADLYSNSDKSYADFMAGSGRQFMQDARANAARSGKIGSYMNSGKMNTDLQAQYLAWIDNRAKALANAASTTTPYVTAYNQMNTNKNAPLINAGIGSLLSYYG